MKNYIQEGERITWTNGTGSDVAAGDPVVIGSQIGVACVDIADGDSGAVAMEGVFELPKATGTAIPQGDKALFIVADGNFNAASTTAAAGDISGCCVAWEAAASAATVVRVKLNVGAGTVEAGP